ncbi:hypothetical protein AMAG_06319 [Allomyces macrogynus ATCC 38327]|uniref:C1q domain-containing protein n=1 Tax=Allomyces macrogynus (strain ATCC 38327) TaxID=578462 RepID=A0A0L0SGD1_ALLM3|nr:hypothetical protein AMAG_06319 [Allomyces macrogynus ATCC 38327]|eukprot:KNE61502.1 hypothetical protein AMAG_06319 [Allomyces macrogynus ATCC 38327]
MPVAVPPPPAPARLPNSARPASHSSSVAKPSPPPRPRATTSHAAADSTADWTPYLRANTSHSSSVASSRSRGGGSVSAMSLHGDGGASALSLPDTVISSTSLLPDNAALHHLLNLTATDDGYSVTESGTTSDSASAVQFTTRSVYGGDSRSATPIAPPSTIPAPAAPAAPALAAAPADEDSDHGAWRQVPAVLRETVKQILVAALQQNAAALTCTPPRLADRDPSAIDARLASVEDAHSQLAHDHGRLRAAHDALQATHTRVLTEYEHLRARHDETLRRVDVVQAQHAQEMAEHEQRYDKAMHRFDALQAMHDLVLERLHVVETCHDTETQDGRQVEAMRGQLDDLRSQHDALDSKYQQLCTKHEDLSTKHEQLGADFAVARAGQTTLHKSHEALCGDVDAVQEDMAVLRKENDSLRDDVGTIQSDVPALRKEFNTLRADMDAVQAETTAFRQEQDVLRADVDAVHAGTAALRKRHDALRVDVVAQFQESRSRRPERPDLHATDFERLDRHAASTTAEVADLAARVASLDVVVESLAAKALFLEARLAESTSRPPSPTPSPAPAVTSTSTPRPIPPETVTLPVDEWHAHLVDVRNAIFRDLHRTLLAEIRAPAAPPAPPPMLALDPDSSQEPLVRRLDVELLVEARVDELVPQLDQVAARTADAELAIQDLTEAVTQMHERMALASDVAQLRAVVQVVHAATAEVKANIETKLAQSATEQDCRARHDQAADYGRDLADHVRAVADSLASLQAQVGEADARVTASLTAKLDSAALDELLRHVATRDDMKKYLEKKWAVLSRHLVQNEVVPLVVAHARNNAPDVAAQQQQQMQQQQQILQQQQEQWWARTTARVDAAEATVAAVQDVVRRVGDDVRAVVEQLELHQEQHRPAGSSTLTPSPSRRVDDVDTDALSQPGFQLDAESYDILHHKLASTMDEKLFLLASEMSAIRAAQAHLATTLAWRTAMWLWKTGTLKHGSAIPWTVEAQNTDTTNFVWEPGHAVVRVAEAGVYELAFAFFTKCKPSIQVVVNGESVMSAIHSPTYTVHHGSGYVTDGDTGRTHAGAVTGMSLHDYLALPAKSTVCLHWHGKVDHAVEGFMTLRRLN